MSLLFSQHSGPVRALDVNPSQPHLLATGASSAEIFIWDLHNPSVHLSPGPKASPADDVSAVAWNRQVPHILASTAISGRTLIWDLRASKAVISLLGKVTNTAIAWDPDKAMEVAIASEDDQHPVVQFWDLRHCMSPNKESIHHTRGVLAMDWCVQDTRMLLTCGKDNRTVCIDSAAQPADAFVAELAPAANWVFQVKWCPRNPELVATASFDGCVAVHTLWGSGGSTAGEADGPGLQGAEGQQPSFAHAPRWLKRPCGATFGFGGRLASFNAAVADQHSVRVSAISTDPALSVAGRRLAMALTAANTESLSEYCLERASASGGSDAALLTWQFLEATTQQEPRPRFLQLLGYDLAGLSQLIGQTITNDSGRHVADAHSTLHGSEPPPPTQRTEQLLTRALLLGGFEAAVDLCLHEHRMADALMIAMTGGPTLMERVQKAYFAQQKTATSTLISSIVSHDWMKIVQGTAVGQWRDALAASLTYAGAMEFSSLCTELGLRLERANMFAEARLCYICAGDVGRFVRAWTATVAQPVSSGDLATIVEQGVMLWQSTELKVDAVMHDRAPLWEYIYQFVELLAAGGIMDAAAALTNHLVAASPVDSTGGDRIVRLQARLNAALGRSVPVVTYDGPVANTCPSSLPSPGLTGATSNHPVATAATMFGAAPSAFPPAAFGGSAGPTVASQHVQAAPQFHYPPAHAASTAPIHGKPSGSTASAPLTAKNQAAVSTPPTYGRAPVGPSAVAAPPSVSTAAPATAAVPPMATPALPNAYGAASSPSLGSANMRTGYPPKPAGMPAVAQPPPTSFNTAPGPNPGWTGAPGPSGYGPPSQPVAAYGAPSSAGYGMSPSTMPPPVTTQPPPGMVAGPPSRYPQPAAGYSMGAPPPSMAAAAASTMPRSYSQPKEADKRWNDPPSVMTKKKTTGPVAAAITNPVRPGVLVPPAAHATWQGQPQGGAGVPGTWGSQQQQQMQSPVQQQQQQQPAYVPPAPVEPEPGWHEGRGVIVLPRIA